MQKDRPDVFVINSFCKYSLDNSQVMFLVVPMLTWTGALARPIASSAYSHVVAVSNVVRKWEIVFISMIGAGKSRVIAIIFSGTEPGIPLSSICGT